MVPSRFIVVVMIWGTHTILLPAEGGSCWASYDLLSGKCVALLYLKVSHEYCCSRSGFSFTEEDRSTEEIFRSIITEGGVSNCLPCTSSGGDVCESITCKRDEVCVAVNGQPRCECDPDCSTIDHDVLVCGSDGKTYSNECTLKMNRCRQRIGVQLAYYGQCQESCTTVECAHGTCLEDELGFPHCLTCSSECQEFEVQGSVCGRDENTYESACHLRLTSCEIGQAITKNNSGRCIGSTNCSSFLCMDGNVCAMDNKPHCSTCPAGRCARHSLRALCGSDDVTYSHLCAMKKTICDTRVYLKRQHFGPCARDLIHIPQLDGEAYFRHYLTFYHHEHVSQPVTTALIRRLTTGTEGNHEERTEGNEIHTEDETFDDDNDDDDEVEDNDDDDGDANGDDDNDNAEEEEEEDVEEEVEETGPRRNSLRAK